jgi:hypothetical protein
MFWYGDGGVFTISVAGATLTVALDSSNTRFAVVEELESGIFRGRLGASAIEERSFVAKGAPLDDGQLRVSGRQDG